MDATDFRERNRIFVKPAEMTDEECGPLPVYAGEGQIISCWRVTDEDMARIRETHVIWLHVIGSGQPPVYVGSECPFVYEDQNTIQ